MKTFKLFWIILCLSLFIIQTDTIAAENLPEHEMLIEQIEYVLDDIGVKDISDLNYYGKWNASDDCYVYKCIADGETELFISCIYYGSDIKNWFVYRVEESNENYDFGYKAYYVIDSLKPYMDIYSYETGNKINARTLDSDDNIILIGNYYYGGIDGKHYIYKFHDDGIVEIVITNGSSKEDKVQVKKSYAAYEVDGRKIIMSAEDTKTFIISEDGRKIWLGENDFEICTENGLLKKELNAFD